MARILTADEVKEALVSSKGMVSFAAATLQCTPQAIYQRIARDPEIAEIVNNIREATTDVAEMALLNAIGRNEPWAIAFYLKTQGKGRGYVERTEQTKNVNILIRGYGPIPIGDV